MDIETIFQTDFRALSKTDGNKLILDLMDDLEGYHRGQAAASRAIGMSAKSFSKHLGTMNTDNPTAPDGLATMKIIFTWLRITLSGVKWHQPLVFIEPLDGVDYICEHVRLFPEKGDVIICGKKLGWFSWMTTEVNGETRRDPGIRYFDNPNETVGIDIFPKQRVIGKLCPLSVPSNA